MPPNTNVPQFPLSPPTPAPSPPPPKKLMPTYVRVLRVLTYIGIFWYALLCVVIGVDFFAAWFFTHFNIATPPDFIAVPLLLLVFLPWFAGLLSVLWGPALLILSIVSFIVERRYRRRNNLQDKKYWHYPSFWLGALSGATSILILWVIFSGALLHWTPV